MRGREERAREKGREREGERERERGGGGESSPSEALIKLVPTGYSKSELTVCYANTT